MDLSKIKGLMVMYSPQEVEWIQDLYPFLADIDFIIMNNGTCSQPSSFPKNWRFIDSGGNIGLPKPKNRAIAMHLVSCPDTEYFIILSPDIVLRDKWLNIFKFFEQHKNLAAVGAACCVSGGALGDMRRTENYGWVSEMGDAFLVIRRSALDSIGRFDPRYFLHGFDIDWCRRARGMGYDLLAICDDSVQFRANLPNEIPPWLVAKIDLDNYMLDEQYIGNWHNWRQDFGPFSPSHGGQLRVQLFIDRFQRLL